jgi:hypothetical protein
MKNSYRVQYFVTYEVYIKLFFKAFVTSCCSAKTYNVKIVMQNFKVHSVHFLRLKTKFGSKDLVSVNIKY